MNILVTGGSGFIGSSIVDLLIDKGHKVRVFDRQPPKNSKAEWVQGDLTWVGDCYKATQDIDAVFHLAARISVDESLDYIWHYFYENILGTVNLLLAAERNKVKHFIYTSSCEVYGDAVNATEESPCNPTSPYAASKYAAERAVFAFCRSFNMKLTVFRPFNTFGERQKAFRAGSLIPTLVLKALKGEELVIHGDGSQTRDYVYVGDIAEAQCMALDRQGEKARLYNISSGREISVKEVAEKIAGRLGARIRFVDDPRKGAQLLRSFGNSELIRKELGWQPKLDFDAALDRVIEYYKEVWPKEKI